MQYALYKNIRNAAWQCLIDCNITELPVSVGKIVRHYGAKIIYNSDVDLLCEGESGRIVIYNDDVVIVVRDSEPQQCLRFTILHEIGHYLLGHLGAAGELSRDKVTSPDEQSADAFAARVLMPAVVLWAMNVQTPDEIAVNCNVSHAAAEIRAKRLVELKERGMFLSHPLERQIRQQFNAFIVQNIKHFH